MRYHLLDLMIVCYRNRKLYEEEKRLRILQMEAIKILYHEVSSYTKFITFC